MRKDRENIAHYDAIGGRYRHFKQNADLPIPEDLLVRTLIGDLTGRSALDLACGYGHYTRASLDAGAERAVGVDISAAMVKEAQATVPGADFVVGDAKELPRIGAFDVVTAVWLLNYATSRTALHGMFASACRNLAPGGRLVAVTVHPEFDPAAGGWEPYGLRILGRQSHTSHDELDCELFTSGDAFAIHISRWASAECEQAANQAGLTRLTWHLPPIPTRGQRPTGHWDAFMNNPFIVGLTARKPTTPA